MVIYLRLMMCPWRRWRSLRRWWFPPPARMLRILTRVVVVLWPGPLMLQTLRVWVFPGGLVLVMPWL